MEDFRKQIQQFLKDLTGKNPEELEFKDIDPNITKDQLNIDKVRGCLALSEGRIKTPADVDKLWNQLLSTPLP